MNPDPPYPPHPPVPPEPLIWKTSTKCDTGSCVAIAVTNNHVHVGNSTDAGAGTLTFTHREWATELHAVRTDGLPHGLSLLLPEGTMLWQHDGSSVKFTRHEVAAFIDGVLGGEFDLPGVGDA